MSGTENTSFARLVSLACHDLRTPLATVHGFARTLTRMEIEQPMARYLEMIDGASDQLAELLDDLGLAARIESGRYEPALRHANTLELARAAAEVREGVVEVAGAGGTVETDPDAAARAMYNLARCAVRHGGLERLDLRAEGPELTFAPITNQAAPIVLGDELRDMGAAVARRAVEALGGSVALEGETLRVRLPPPSSD